MPIEPRQILPLNLCGYGYDVRIPPDGRRYDARTIISMVKLVNRRGMVRYATRWTSKKDGKINHNWWEKPKESIAGYNEHREWVQEALDDSTLFVSFSDRFEARRFCADLESLRQIRLKRDPKLCASQAGKPVSQL